jgi:hypothetical protein
MNDKTTAPSSEYGKLDGRQGEFEIMNEARKHMTKVIDDLREQGQRKYTSR